MAWGVAYFSDALEGWLLGVARGAAYFCVACRGGAVSGSVVWSGCGC